MDGRTIWLSSNKGCSGPCLSLFVAFLSHATCWLTNMPPWHDKSPPLWGNGCAVCRSPQQLCLFLFFFLLLPVASLFLFSFAFYTQAIKSVSQHCDPLQLSLFLFFVIFLFLSFSPSLLLAGFFHGWGGWGWGRDKRRKSRGWGGGYIWSFMTNHMCFWVLYLHVSHGKECGGKGWWERKDKHMVLVCWVKFRVKLFVSCDEQREIQILLLPRQWLRLFLGIKYLYVMHSRPT